MTSVFFTSIGNHVQSITSCCKSALTRGAGAAGAMVPNAFSSSLTALQGVIGPLLEARSDKNLEKKIEKLFDELQANQTPKNVLIEQFVRSIWDLATAGIDVLQGTKNQKVLYDKLFQILLPRPPCKENMIVICKNVIKNFQASSKETLERLTIDLETEDFKKTFSLKGHPRITSLTRLGEETHHKGRAPFLVEFSSGKKVVYKPRSMAAEKHITASNNSLFSKLSGIGRHLGTYQVLDRGEYGYCEFIENKEEENTFETKKSLRKYASHLAELDTFASSVSLTDLHNGNIATKRKIPTPIDCEVLMGPEIKIEGYRFDTMAMNWHANGPVVGWFADKDTINQVFWKESDSLKCLGGTSDSRFFIDYTEKASREISIKKKEESIIEETKARLKDQKHRFVLIDTETLSGFIKKPLTEETKQEFLEEIQKRMDAYEIHFDVSKAEIIWKQFSEDVMNNDVPVFYYHPASKTAFYDDIKLGQCSD